LAKNQDLTTVETIFEAKFLSRKGFCEARDCMFFFFLDLFNEWGRTEAFMLKSTFEFSRDNIHPPLWNGWRARYGICLESRNFIFGYRVETAWRSLECLEALAEVGSLIRGICHWPRESECNIRGVTNARTRSIERLETAVRDELNKIWFSAEALESLR